MIASFIARQQHALKQHDAKFQFHNYSRHDRIKEGQTVWAMQGRRSATQKERNNSGLEVKGVLPASTLSMVQLEAIGSAEVDKVSYSTRLAR